MNLVVTDDTVNDILTNNKVVVIDFWAEWCGPCRMLGPIIEELANESSDIAIKKMNVDTNPITTHLYNITSIPTLIFFKDGVEVDRVRGIITKPAIAKKISNITQ